MSDLREKLEAMAGQTEQSPHEAEIARLLLAKLDASAKRGETPGVLSRAAILAQPGVTGPRQAVRIRYPSGTWVHLYADEVDWEMVDAHHLRWRFDGEDREHIGVSIRNLDEILNQRGNSVASPG